MKTISYKKECELQAYREVDVLVVGGGPAGISAAVCAGRRGVKVLLCERDMSLGGTATNGLVGPFMTCSDPKGERMLIRGFFEELVNRLIAVGGAIDPMSIANCDGYSSWHEFGHRNVTPFNSEALKFEAESMCLESGVELLYGVQGMDVILSKSGDRLDGVVFLGKEGLLFIAAKVVIDCTGDGDVAHLAGCPMMKGDETTGEMQAGSLFFVIDGVNEAALQARKDAKGWQAMRFTDEINQAVEAGEYPIPRRRLGMYKSNDGTWRCNITRIPDVDGSTTAGQNKIMQVGRVQIAAILKFLRKYVRGCESIRLVSSATLPGIRETRRIRGSFVMEESSIVAGEMFPDRILILSNSRDAHIGLVGRYIPQEVVYSLPYRMLVPQGVGNLLAAGRNVSCDRSTLSAIRVMPPCFGLGQAAGNAAVLAVRDKCSCAEIDVAELQDWLRQENVVLD